jgi:hypothetical protein
VWTLEPVKGGTYHKVAAQMPDKQNVVRIIGERLLVLGKSPFLAA